jgi:hypothetical protein
MCVIISRTFLFSSFLLFCVILNGAKQNEGSLEKSAVRYGNGILHFAIAMFRMTHISRERVSDSVLNGFKAKETKYYNNILFPNIKLCPETKTQGTGPETSSCIKSRIRERFFGSASE